MSKIGFSVPELIVGAISSPPERRRTPNGASWMALTVEGGRDQNRPALLVFDEGKFPDLADFEEGQVVIAIVKHHGPARGGRPADVYVMDFLDRFDRPALAVLTGSVEDMKRQVDDFSLFDRDRDAAHREIDRLFERWGDGPEPPLAAPESYAEADFNPERDSSPEVERAPNDGALEQPKKRRRIGQNKQQFAPDYVRDALSYDPETGKLTWRKDRPDSHFDSPQKAATWRKRYGGKEAGKARSAGQYKQLSLNGVSLSAHRVAWLFIDGDWPGVGVIVDHQDGQRENNRPDNLRLATPKENARNLGKSANNTSGQTGVAWHSVKGLWTAFISVRKKVEGEDGSTTKVVSVQTHLGYFGDLEDVVTRRQTAEHLLGYHENHGQRPSLERERQGAEELDRYLAEQRPKDRKALKELRAAQKYAAQNEKAPRKTEEPKDQETTPPRKAPDLDETSE